THPPESTHPAHTRAGIRLYPDGVGNAQRPITFLAPVRPGRPENEMSRSSDSTGRQRARLSVESLEDRTTPTFLPSGPGGTLGGSIGVGNAVVPTTGLSIAAGDLFPDQITNLFGFVDNEYVLGSGPGVSSLVQVYSLNGTLRSAFSPFPGFKGGINVA